MNKYLIATLIGVHIGILLLASVLIPMRRVEPLSRSLGGSPYNGHIGIYNATPTDNGLRDGYGSALLTDSAGRVIVTSTSP